jgi:hypothetical protein
MTRLSEAQIADLKDRVDLVRLAGDLGARLRRSGAKWVGSCPVCGGGARATRFEIKGEGWVCAVCEDGGDAIRLVRQVSGCDFASAIERLGGPRVLDQEEERKLQAQREARARKERAEADAYRERERAACLQIWERGRAPSPERLGRYWEARGLLLPGTALIREAEDVAFFHGKEIDEQGREHARVLYRGPAQLAAFLDNEHHFVGLHLTHLLPDWSGKAVIVDPDTGEVLPAKKMRGSKKGSHIVLRQPPFAAIEAARRDGQSIRLFMGEGIETTGQVGTSLKRAGRLHPLDMFWASGDLGNLGGASLGTIAHPDLKTPKGRPQRVPSAEPDRDAPAIRIPDEVTHLCLLGDGDSEPVLTRTTLERGRARYARPGLQIAIAMAPTGEDFNSMTRGAA